MSKQPIEVYLQVYKEVSVKLRKKFSFLPLKQKAVCCSFLIKMFIDCKYLFSGILRIISSKH